MSLEDWRPSAWSRYTCPHATCDFFYDDSNQDWERTATPGLLTVRQLLIAQAEHIETRLKHHCYDAHLSPWEKTMCADLATQMVLDITRRRLGGHQQIGAYSISPGASVVMTMGAIEAYVGETYGVQ